VAKCAGVVDVDLLLDLPDCRQAVIQSFRTLKPMRETLLDTLLLLAPATPAAEVPVLMES